MKKVDWLYLIFVLIIFMHLVIGAKVLYPLASNDTSITNTHGWTALIWVIVWIAITAEVIYFISISEHHKGKFDWGDAKFGALMGGFATVALTPVIGMMLSGFFEWISIPVNSNKFWHGTLMTLMWIGIVGLVIGVIVGYFYLNKKLAVKILGKKKVK